MIEDFKKYKFFYVNGSSFTEGGGLEEQEIKINSVIPMYEKKYGITWKYRNKVNFGKRLEEIIGINCINEAKSGSGVDRLVRTTYDFIFKNWKHKDEFFIILEKPDASRSDVFYTKTNKYYVVNSTYKKNSKKLEFENATREYFNKKYITDVEDLKIFENWFKNHYNFQKKILQDDRAFIGLYSFCKLHSIKIFVMQKTDCLFIDCFENADIINFENKKTIDSIDNWCYKNKMTIRDEIGHNDNHPGYFGHIEYAKKLANFLGWDGEYPMYPTIKKEII